VVTKDEVSATNLCLKDEKELDEVTIKDLKIKEISENTVLWVKTITNACNLESVRLIVEDKNGEVVCL